MYKKIAFLAITIFSLNSLFLVNTHAEDGIITSSETEDEVLPTTEDNPVEGTISLDDIDNADSSLSEATDSELENDIIHNGTSGEGEVVCANPNESGCNNADTTPEVIEENGEAEEIDPEFWPLYISLGALGGTILLVIILNLIGRHKK